MFIVIYICAKCSAEVAGLASLGCFPGKQWSSPANTGLPVQVKTIPYETDCPGELNPEQNKFLRTC